MAPIYDGDENVRFALGRAGASPIFIVGINPSTANDQKSDPTVGRVEKLVAGWREFDGFVMLNLYPQRASKPKRLISPFDEKLKRLNAERIAAHLRSVSGATVWAAWGDAFDRLDDFNACLLEILAQANGLGLRWKNCESLTLKHNPRHPLSGRPHVMTEKSQLTDFDIVKYLSRKGRKKST